METTKYDQCDHFNGIDLSSIPFRSFTGSYTVAGISHTVRYQQEITTSYQYINQNKHSTSWLLSLTENRVYVVVFPIFRTIKCLWYESFFIYFFCVWRSCVDVIMANGGWRECANWLTRCGALRADHKVNWPESTIDDLAHTLRDGVILCNLLNTLEPGCLGTRDINQKPQMAQVIIL